jgi:hypothetical protein
LWKAVEEEFDLPATAIQFGDCQCRQREVVRQEDQSLAGLGIVESPRHEETAGGVQSEEPFEAEISAVHHIERAGLGQRAMSHNLICGFVCSVLETVMQVVKRFRRSLTRRSRNR